MKAIIFDMDGVLINSEVAYQKLFMQFLKEREVFVTKEELLFLVGCSRETEDAFMAFKLDVSCEVAKTLKDEFFKKHEVNYLKIRMPYVKELLSFLKKHQIKLALASSSPMNNILNVLKQCEIENCFSIVVSGEMFKRTKPDPEIYEYTCKKIGMEKSDILAIEDSKYGIEAAKRAGIKVIGLYNKDLYQDLSNADRIINTLNEIMEEKLWLEL